MQLNYNEAKMLLKDSKLLLNQEELYKAISIMANNIEKEIINQVPVFLTIMNGGLYFAAELLKQIKSPFLSDYIHISRYGPTLQGSMHLTWYRQPHHDLIKDKIIYVVDDLLDEGITLLEVTRFLYEAGAKDCKIVVLVDKNLGKPKPIKADHFAFTAPNHFLFGFGMDIFGLYRQLPNIYIYNSQEEKK